jgi:hypothetical protein
VSKETVRQIYKLYEQNYEYRNEAAAFCFWSFIVCHRHEEKYLHTFLNLVMTCATDNTNYFSINDLRAIISAQQKDTKELRRIWRIILYDTSNFDYDSFQAIICVDELLESLDIESVWHFDVPVELFGNYKHILEMKEVDSQPFSKNGDSTSS